METIDTWTIEQSQFEENTIFFNQTDEPMLIRMTPMPKQIFTALQQLISNISVR